MKLINNRYRVESIIDKGPFEDSYKVIDLWDDSGYKYMRLYSPDNEQLVIDYFIKNFLNITKINHPNILKDESFNTISTINSKPTNINMYYCITEEANNMTLKDILPALNLEQRLNIVLQITSALDFLHFRGFLYRYLSPTNVLIEENGTVKLMNYSRVIRNSLNSYYDDLTRSFVSPEILTNPNYNRREADYFSLGMIIKYILELNINKFKVEISDFPMKFNIEPKGKILLLDIINRLIGVIEGKERINLKEIKKSIVQEFILDYDHNLLEERNHLLFKGDIIGREEEINSILELDNQIQNYDNFYQGIIVKGHWGSGKTRFLNEVSFLLRMRGREVYYTKIGQGNNSGMSAMADIINQSIKNAPIDIINRYEEQLNKIISELRIDIDDGEINIDNFVDKIRIYNKIKNYLSELSRDKIIYIIMDNLQRVNINLINLLDYLIKNLNNKNVHFILSYAKGPRILNSGNREILEKLFDENNLLDIELGNLNEEDTGKLVKDILGISYIPKKFASILFQETQGNPGYIIYTMKDLHNRGELYIDEYGYWEVKTEDYLDIEFPTNINEIFSGQLDGIDEEYLLILKSISVFKSVPNRKMLLNMLNIDHNKFDTIVANLVEQRLIEAKISDWGFSYNIYSNEVKRIIYNRLKEEEKWIMHGKVANIIEELFEDRIHLILEEYIYQLIRSNNPEQALSVILNETSQIDNKYSSHSIALLEKAYRISKSRYDEDRLYVLDGLVDCYFLKGDIEKINIYLRELLNLAEQLNSPYYIIRGKLFLAELYLRQNNIELAMKEILEIENIAEEEKIHQGLIHCLIIKAKIQFAKGNLELTNNYCNEALKISETYNIEEYLGTIYNIKGLTNYLQGNIESSISEYEKSINYFEKVKNYIDVTKPINNLGNIYGDIYNNKHKAMEYYERGLKITEEYGFMEAHIVFLNNIGEIYFKQQKYSSSLKYLEEAKEGAISIKDFRIELASYINLGKAYLFSNKFSEAFKYYNLLKDKIRKHDINDAEILSHYNEYLSYFYEKFGHWRKAKKYTELVKEYSKDFNPQEYLKSQSRILYFDFLEKEYLDKGKIKENIDRYEDDKFINEKIKSILKFVRVALLHNDREYVKELLRQCKEIVEQNIEDFPTITLDIIELSFNGSVEDIHRVREELKAQGNIDLLGGEFNIRVALGDLLFDKDLYIESIQEFIIAFEILHKLSKEIPDCRLRRDYIRINQGDLIKKRIVSGIERQFNKKVVFEELQRIKDEKLDEYFDMKFLVDYLNDEEISEIANYGYIQSIRDLEELIKEMGNDYKYNLDLILKYIGKKVLAEKGQILHYDEGLKKYLPIASLDEKCNLSLNQDILMLANRKKDGLLFQRGQNNISQHKEIISEDIMGIICIPISIADREKSNVEDRRKGEDHRRVVGYIYLETKKSLNRFDDIRFNLINNLLYLIYINIENNNLKQISTTDRLTGVYTRKYFESLLELELETSRITEQNHSLLMIDIDRFKTINDTYGHRKGDEVLARMGQEILNSIRTSDLVGKYGGEEFIVLLANTTEKEARLIGQKIKDNIEGIKIPGIEYPITVSMGISCYPVHSQFKEDLIERADQALYHAKDTGRNKMVIWENQIEDVFHRTDKLAGIVTGQSDIDTRNALTTLAILELFGRNITVKGKIFKFLGSLIETLDLEFSSLIILNKNREIKEKFSRKAQHQNWVNEEGISHSIINRVIDRKQGEFIIDWNYNENIDLLGNAPTWQSIIAQPLIWNEEIIGVVYLSVPLKSKELDYDHYNLTKMLCNIFVPIANIIYEEEEDVSHNKGCSEDGWGIHFHGI